MVNIFGKKRTGMVVAAIAIALGGGLLWKGYSSYQENQENQAKEPLHTPVLPNIDSVVGTPRFHARRNPKGYSKGNVASVSFSPDGRTILSANDLTTVKLWDKETGKELITAEDIRPLLRPFNSLRFSPDGAAVLSTVAAHLRSESGDDERTIFRLWDTKTGEILRTFEGQHRLIEEVSFSPDGSTILSVSPYGLAELWDATTGHRIRNIELCNGSRCKRGDPKAQGRTGHRGFIRDASFSPDGGTILSASLDDTVKVWDANTGTLVRTLGEYSGDNNWDDNIRSARFSPDGSLIMTTSGTALAVWNVETGERLHLETEQGIAPSLGAFSPNGSTIAIAPDTFPSTITILDTNVGETLRTFEIEQYSTNKSMAFSPDGGTLALGNTGGNVSLWNPATGQQLHTLTQGGSSVDALAFSPDGKTLAIGQGRAVRLWDLVTRKELSTVAGHTTSVASVAFGPDDRTIISSTARNKTTKVWDAMTGKELPQAQGIEPSITQEQNGDSPPTIADTSFEDNFRVVVLKDGNTGKLLRTFPRHSAEAVDVALNPAGNLVAALHRDGVVKLWNAQTGAEVRQWQDQSLHFGGVSFSADGKILASIFPKRIQIWDVATGNTISTVENVGFITSDQAVLSPDGTMVVAFDNGGRVMAWEVATGKLLGVIGGPDGESGKVMDARFNSDGTALVAGYEDGSVKAWNLHRDRFQSLVDRAQDRVSQVRISTTGNKANVPQVN